jgi:predicted amidohydrolase YtcJ
MLRHKVFYASPQIAIHRLNKLGKNDTLSADLALVNAKVLIMNPSQPIAEAIAVKKDRVARVGTNAEISEWIGENTRVIDLRGKTVVPGFIDTHIHVADFGRFLMWLDLKDVKSIKQLQRVLEERAQKTPSGKWIVGRGWNQARFREKRLPAVSDLDSVSPKNPVILYHESAMLCIVNSRALEIAGITRLTIAHSGGTIDKDAETGEPTGILRDSATDLVWKMVPQPSEAELLDATALACEKIVEAGVTTVHWVVLSATEISIIGKLYAQRRLPVRVYVIIPLSLLDKTADVRLRADSMLRVGGALIVVDGYLAAKTAALFEPYNGEPQQSGKLLYTQKEMDSAASEALRAGVQPVLQAMGDRAVYMTLTTIKRASRESLRKDVRWRIEQAAVLNEALIERMKAQHVIVSVQPRVIASEFSVWSATEHLGVKRVRWLYPLKTLLQKGVRVIGGSDCPMEPLNLLMGMQDAVTREAFPKERVTAEEALRMYTVDAAYSSSEEDIKGSIEEGKLADLTVLSSNPLAVAHNQISKIAVEMTIVGGNIVFSKY